MKTDAGFTLIEILVVVLIITILATIVGVNVIPHLGKANVAAATAQIREFKTALKLYQMDSGMVPTQRQGLLALCVKPDTPPVPNNYPQDGYLDGKLPPRDPWGRDYVYLAPSPDGSAYEIISYGSDGEPGGQGTAADISSLVL
jgi:general secretion pathway protein G